MAKVGRPTVFTPEVEAKFLELLRQGHYLNTASALVRIERTTAAKRIARGLEAGEGPDYDFALAVAEARAEAEQKLLAVIDEAATGYEVVTTQEHLTATGDLVVLRKIARERQWQAAAWRLERMFPDKYGRRAAEVIAEAGEGQATVRIVIPDNGRGLPGESEDLEVFPDARPALAPGDE